MRDSISIPVQTIGPVKIIGPEVNAEIQVPLATYETPMWPSTNRGASVTRRCGGVLCTVLDDRMTRSILLEGEDAGALKNIVNDLDRRREALETVVSSTSRFCKLLAWNVQIVGNLLYLRLEAQTGDASGHNMLTKAADAVINWILHEYPSLRYVSISGNICTDKKASAINGLLGRGKYVVAEMHIPREICIERLKTTPEKIVNLHVKKNLIGSNIAGGIRTANAHFANLLYAFYVATGQDVANIIEGSQGLVHAEMRDNDLYFSVTLPNIIVGTVGNGKDYDFVKEHLAMLGCLEPREPGQNARRLAIACAATVLCGELSLLAAQTNRGELMRAHEKFERHSTARLPKKKVAAVADRELLKVRTPAKLILSGEHAVVHGHPALAIAVDRYIEATARWTSPLHLSFNLMGIDFKREITLHALEKLKHKIKEKYHKYNLGRLSIREVLQKPFELSLFTAINVLDKLKNKLPMGLDIVTDSNIPIGCGMGSSAASVVNIVFALANFLDIDLNLNEYIKLGIESENLQHGNSSGLDVYTVYHGGAVRYKNGEFNSRNIPDFPMTIVQTGRPHNSTGECVAHTNTFFKDSAIGNDFAAITDQLDNALQQNNLPEIQDCIRTNHRLLKHIGVVPEKVHEFIKEVEKLGGAGKVCGAGAMKGDQAGTLLIVSESDVTAVAEKYGYNIMPVKIDTRGTCVV